MKKNSIAENRERFPFLVEQFHPTKNAPLTIENVTIKSARDIVWICNKGHEWTTKPYHRTSKGDGSCPICSGKKITREKSLGGQHPDLVPFYSKRNKEDIFELGEFSSKQLWWECDKGHEYQARPSIKVRAADKHWCPVCAGHEVVVECEECGEKFANTIGLATHMRIKHDSGIKTCSYYGCQKTIRAGRTTCQKHGDLSHKMKFEMYEERVLELEEKSNCQILTSYEQFVSRNTEIKFSCHNGHEFTRTMNAAFNNSALCPICFPKGASILENELSEFVESLEVEIIRNSRDIIKPLEIDVYVPEHKLGIELNGLYWHSERFKEKDYHVKKNQKAFEMGIRLINIFEDDWRERRSICESMIKHALGKTEKRIYARQCDVVELNASERRSFFEQNHIMGDAGARRTYALKYEGVIVSALSVRKSINHKNSLEIARFATLLEAQIPGGFSKLLKHVKKYAISNNFNKIITYSHNMYGTGNVYERTDFEYVKDTGVDYWYTKDNRRFSRMTFRARDGKTEKQVAEEAGVLKIYGCGSKLFRMRLI